MKHEAWCSVESTWNNVKIITCKSVLFKLCTFHPKRLNFEKKCQTEIIMFKMSNYSRIKNRVVHMYLFLNFQNADFWLKHDPNIFPNFIFR